MSDPKRDAAERAVGHVGSGMVLGLGSGSTAAFAVQAIGRLVRAGTLRDVVGIPTSRETRDLAAKWGIPLSSLDQHPVVDVTIDGADEVDPAGDLIKGGGGALLWEKIVAVATRTYVIVVDESKLVDRLGTGFALPVEVMPFGWRTHLAPIRELGAEPVLRVCPSGEPYVTDGGHYLLDCRFAEGIADARDVDRALHARPGIVETGLFLGMRPEVIVGRRGGG